MTSNNCSPEDTPQTSLQDFSQIVTMLVNLGFEVVSVDRLQELILVQVPKLRR